MDWKQLVKWSIISLPKKLGGWDIKNILWFAQALAMKILWKGLFGQGIWSEVLRDKYLRKILVVDWFHCEKKQVLNASNIWRGLLELVPSMSC